LKQDYYFRVYFNKNNFNNKNSIVCTNDEWIDVYDISNFDLVDEINYDNFGSINISSDGRLLAIISSDIKKIAIYDQINKSIVWEYQTKKYPIKLYGINFGKINDPVLYCDFAWEKEKLFLYYTSGFGNLMKFDAKTGEIKLIKERFMGSGNNAGAIVNFKFADFNKDGHVDLVGPSVDHNVYCINGQDFSVIWKYNSGYENQSPVSLYDITGDGVPEVIGVSDKMKLFIIDGASGSPIEEIVLSNRKDQSIVALCDFNGNERLDLVVKSDYNKIKVFEINSVKVQKNAIIQPPY
jgi:WD40 repeat protein